MLTRATLTVTSCLLLTAVSIAQEGGLPAGPPRCPRSTHEQQLPGTPQYQDGFNLLGDLGPGRVYTHDPENIQLITKKGFWRVTPAYHCALAPCSTVPYPGPGKYTQETETKTCWQVSGSVTVEAKLGLAVRLLTDIGASVEIGGKWEDCKRDLTRIEVPFVQYMCFPVKLREVWTETTHFGSVREWSEKWLWQHEVSEEVAHTYCNNNIASGNVLKVASWELQKAPQACPGDSIPPHDAYDNERSYPCCDPYCDPPPGSDICCGEECPT